jgi:hypothetical protein
MYNYCLQAPKGPRDIDAQAIMNDLKAKREALDMAIADIKSAIQRSKQMALHTADTEQQGEATEPVWIRRLLKVFAYELGSNLVITVCHELFLKIKLYGCVH